MWPAKSHQMYLKVAQKRFHYKNDRFVHLYKNCLRMWEIWINKLLTMALKSCPKSNKLPNLVTCNWATTIAPKALFVFNSISVLLFAIFHLFLLLTFSLFTFHFYFHFTSLSLNFDLTGLTDTHFVCNTFQLASLKAHWNLEK